MRVLALTSQIELVSAVVLKIKYAADAAEAKFRFISAYYIIKAKKYSIMIVCVCEFEPVSGGIYYGAYSVLAATR